MGSAKIFTNINKVLRFNCQDLKRFYKCCDFGAQIFLDTLNIAQINRSDVAQIELCIKNSVLERGNHSKGSTAVKKLLIILCFIIGLVYLHDIGNYRGQKMLLLERKPMFYW